MPINLDRAEKIGGDYEDKPEWHNGKLFSQIEVLNTNKVPFQGVSFLREGFYQCPSCKKSTIKQYVNYTCEHCRSRVIYWHCYVTEQSEKHELYDSYITRFYEASAAYTKQLREKRKNV